MNLPNIERTKDWDPAASGLDRHALPISSLMTMWYEIRTPEHIGSHFSWHGVPPNFYTQWSEVSFSTSLPVFSYLPLIQELVLSIQHVGSEWNIEGFQMFGPDIVAPRRSGEAWGLARVGPHNKAAAEYFVSRGITADNGKEWMFPYDNSGQEVDSISDSIDTQMDRNHIDNPHSTITPRIGFYGFSRGTMSLGGKWVGFRYFTETIEVHFSPLAWSDVEFFFRRYYAPDGYTGRMSGCPQLIAHVWLIRPGNKAEPEQPHHCWLKVKKWEEGDPDWVAQVETMWKMVRAHLLVRNCESAYRLCVADDSRSY